MKLSLVFLAAVVGVAHAHDDQQDQNQNQQTNDHNNHHTQTHTQNQNQNQQTQDHDNHHSDTNNQNGQNDQNTKDQVAFFATAFTPYYGENPGLKTWFSSYSSLIKQLPENYKLYQTLFRDPVFTSWQTEYDHQKTAATTSPKKTLDEPSPTKTEQQIISTQSTATTDKLVETFPTAIENPSASTPEKVKSATDKSPSETETQQEVNETTSTSSTTKGNKAKTTTTASTESASTGSSSATSSSTTSSANLGSNDFAPMGAIIAACAIALL